VAVLEVRNLKTYFSSSRGEVRAVDDVSFNVEEGETLGIVGESGSGKSMTALSIVQLVPAPAGRIVGGGIKLDGRELLTLSDEEMRRVRGSEIGMILQDPQSSLNPVFSIGFQLEEMFQLTGRKSREAVRAEAVKALRDVQIPDAERRISNFPHEMSGGMKQRVVGAIAISRNPRVIIADEPTTSLDVTIQAQYLRLLRSIQEQTGTSVIFITHDFGIVARMCNRVAVMYAGRIVEQAGVQEIFDNPRHPYTQALIRSVPSPKRKVTRLESIEGQPPAPWDLPAGCRFAPRCPFCMERCKTEYPPSFDASGRSKGPHMVACWLMEEES
jgi:oligopeptide/dipeptide ABC transporter ATP-binding protein